MSSNDALGFRTIKDRIPTKTPTQALRENVKIKFIDIKMMESPKTNRFPRLRPPKKSRLAQNGITSARKFPKLFGFLNTREPNLPEPTYCRLIMHTPDVATINNNINRLICSFRCTQSKTR